MTGDGLVSQFYANNLPGRPLGLLTSQCLLANELILVQFHKEAQTSHDGRDVGRQLVAIQRQAYFETQRVTTAQATGLAMS